MKTMFAVFAIFACIMVVGAIEDPCSTEGLPAGCMEKK
mgnify:FL=1